MLIQMKISGGWQTSMQWTWSIGIWLCVDHRNGQYIFYDPEQRSIKYAWTFMRVPDVEKWSVVKLQSMDAIPWSAHTTEEPDVSFRHQERGPDRTSPDPPPQALYLKWSDLDRFGFTAGCPQCDHIVQYNRARPGANHSELCQERIVKLLATTEDGARRIADMNTKIDKAVVDGIRCREQDINPTSMEGEKRMPYWTRWARGHPDMNVLMTNCIPPPQTHLPAPDPDSEPDGGN